MEGMKREYFLKTKRLGFSIWSMKDKEQAFLLWSNPMVTKYICSSGVFNENDIEKRLETETDK